MKNRKKRLLALLLGTIYLPLVMKSHQACSLPPPDTSPHQAATIRAIATAFANEQQWAIEAVHTWEAAGRPSEGNTLP